MSAVDLPFPLSGRTLVLGPSNAGKTRLTARALDAWINQEGPDGVVVLEFGPEVERDGRLLGGRLSRFRPDMDDVWQGVLEAHAPRAQGGSETESLRLAAGNATRGADIVASAPPEPRALFVNDATIPFQHERGDVEALFGYAGDADLVVLNALESDELGVDDPISRQERAVLASIEEWVDRVVRL